SISQRTILAIPGKRTVDMKLLRAIPLAHVFGSAMASMAIWQLHRATGRLANLSQPRPPRRLKPAKPLILLAPLGPAIVAVPKSASSQSLRQAAPGSDRSSFAASKGAAGRRGAWAGSAPAAFASTAVGSNTTATETLSISSGFTLGEVRVVTQG